MLPSYHPSPFFAVLGAPKAGTTTLTTTLILTLTLALALALPLTLTLTLTLTQGGYHLTLRMGGAAP